MTATGSVGTGSSAAVFAFPLRVSARTDYAIRALAQVAASSDGPISSQRLSDAQAIPQSFLTNILIDLRRAGLVRSYRGVGAGYELARPATDITLADVIAVTERDLSRPTLEEISYRGAAESLRDVWLAVRSSVSEVLGSVTLADVASGTLPQTVRDLAERAHPPAEGTSP